jgi:hypothetical protein
MGVGAPSNGVSWNGDVHSYTRRRKGGNTNLTVLTVSGS